MLQLFGDKIQARALAQRSNVPVVKGSGNLTSGDECLDILNNGDVRLPAIMKVSCFIYMHLFTFLSIAFHSLELNVVVLTHSIFVLGCLWRWWPWYAHCS